MIEQMFNALIPAALLKVASVPASDKRVYAQFLNDLTAAYLSDNREQFTALLEKASFPPAMKKQIVAALWTGEHYPVGKA